MTCAFLRFLRDGLIALFSISAALAAQTPVDEPQTVLVVGEQPGPGLWKVSRDDHVLWILGTHGPLPKNMVWRSRNVESLIAESQEVLFPGRLEVGADVSFFKAVTLLPAIYKVRRNPDDATLKALLPGDTYAKWQVLKQKYIGSDGGIEHWRPTFAADELRDEAMRKSGLTYARNVEPIVSRLAKKHHVRIHVLPLIERQTQLRDPRGILKKAQKTAFPDVECFSRTLERLEPNIEVMKEQANAWSTGDLAALRNVSPNRTEECMAVLMEALMNGALAGEVGAQQAVDDLKKQSERANEELRKSWLDAAEAALATHRSTFAVLPISNLLSPTGYAAALRAKGYVVEEPG